MDETIPCASYRLAWKDNFGKKKGERKGDRKREIRRRIEWDKGGGGRKGEGGG